MREINWPQASINLDGNVRFNDRTYNVKNDLELKLLIDDMNAEIPTDAEIQKFKQDHYQSRYDDGFQAGTDDEWEKRDSQYETLMAEIEKELKWIATQYDSDNTTIEFANNMYDVSATAYKLLKKLGER